MSELYCPYCDSKDVKLGSTTETVEKDDSMIVVKKVLCKECGQTGYAVKTYRCDPGYNCYRRQDLAEETGIRIRTPMFKGRRCRCRSQDRGWCTYPIR